MAHFPMTPEVAVLLADAALRTVEDAQRHSEPMHTTRVEFLAKAATIFDVAVETETASA